MVDADTVLEIRPDLVILGDYWVGPVMGSRPEGRSWSVRRAPVRRPALRGEYLLGLCVGDREALDLVGLVRLVLDRDQGADPLASAPEPRSAFLEVVVRPACTRRGYGREGAHLALSLAFEDLCLHRVWGLRDACDEGAGRLMERLGMTRERVIRHHVFSAGSWRDSVVHSILRHEWDMVRLAGSGRAARAAG